MSKPPIAEVTADTRTAASELSAVPRPRIRWRRRAVWVLCACSLMFLIAWLLAVPSILLEYQAQRQLQRGRPHQAMVWLMWARTLNGTRAELEFLTARTYRVQGEMNLARDHLESAWHLGFPVARLQREQTLALAQSGQFRDAEPALPNLLMDSRGDMADICEAYVIGYIRTYRLNQAERLLAAWLADSPQHPRALLLRAKMQIDLLNWKAAEQDLGRVLDSVPEHADAADILAGVLLKQKQPEAALKVLPVAVRDPRSRLSALLREVECHRIQGDEKVARQRLESILKEYPDSMQAHLELGCVESDLGAFEAAIEELEQARKRAPNSPEVRYALAIALRGGGREAEAKEEFAYVTRAREGVAEAMNLRGKVAQNPGDADLRCRIGTLLLDYGQTDRGLVWLQSVLDVNPQHTDAHRRLALYYENRKDESDEFAKLASDHRKFATAP